MAKGGGYGDREISWIYRKKIINPDIPTSVLSIQFKLYIEYLRSSMIKK